MLPTFSVGGGDEQLANWSFSDILEKGLWKSALLKHIENYQHDASEQISSF